MSTPMCMPSVLVSGSFRQVLLNLDGSTLFRIVARVCRAWRHAALVDDIWTSLLQRDFPLSNLQPLPHAKWIYVYIAEQSRRSVLPTPVKLTPCGQRVHVTRDGQSFHVLLGAHGPTALFGRARCRKSSRDAWTPIEVTLSNTHVTITSTANPTTSTTPMHTNLHLGTTEVKRVKAQLHLSQKSLTSTPVPPTIVEFDTEDVATAWAAAIAHNTQDFQSKFHTILSPTSLTATSAGASPRSGRKFALTLDSRHHLRKYHAFRLTQAIKAEPRPCRQSISSSVLRAFHGKAHDTPEPDNNQANDGLVAHLAAPRCAGGCGRLVDANALACSPKCERHTTLKTTRSGDVVLRRGRAALHLVPEPSIVVLALLHNPNTFEGHAVAQFVGRFKGKKLVTNLTRQAAHGNLCATRDVVANLAQYIVAFRQHELGPCEASGDEVPTAVHLAVERSVCLSMQRWLQSWAEICAADRDQDKLCQRMASWAKVPPTAAQFGLAEEFVLVNWDSAVQYLRDMDHDALPSGKLRHLLHSAKEIFDLYAHSGNGDAGSRALSADDFLPVFIYCVCQASLRAPMATLEFLWSTCSEESLKGEAGYYLTMLEASLEYIRTYAPPT